MSSYNGAVTKTIMLRLLIVAVLLPRSTLGLAGQNPSRRKQAQQQQSIFFTDDSTANHQMVQEILKNRSARGKPRLNYDEMELETENNMWLSLPRRPKRNIAEVAKAKERPKSPPPVSTDESPRKKSTIRTNGIDIPFESTLEALKVFYDEHSHLVIPRRYIVPESNSYPSVWHGIDLAGTVYNMKWWQRHVQNQPDRVSELNSIGFVWERLQSEWNLILESLIVYRGLNGDLLVPSTFVVPYDDESWPKACWGISLGRSVYKIRNRGDYIAGTNPNSWSRRQQLDALGFVWDVDEFRFTLFTSCLELFRKIEQSDHSLSSSAPTHTGALKVPSKFVVPRSSRWPNKYWGYRLGERCTQVRQKELYVKDQPHRIKILADLGFYVQGGSNGNLRWLEVVHAAAVYSQMNDNKLDVPTNFVVPAPPRRVATCFEGDESDKNTDEPCVVGSDDAWPWPDKFINKRGFVQMPHAY